MKIKRKRFVLLLISIGGLFLIIFAVNTIRTHAQTSSNPWALPINLSQSGGATDPAIAIDSDNIYHIIWRDDFLGYVFTKGDGSTWSFPAVGAFPFEVEDAVPKLIADSDGSIYAAWIERDGDLFISRSTASSFGTVNRWTLPFRLATSVADLAIGIDDQNNLHVVFLRTDDTAEQPAGIYYRSSPSLGASWSNPFPIYISPYFRSIQPDEANLVMELESSAESTSIYLLWDNQSRRRIFFSASDDAGETWREPQEVVGPDDSLSVENPAPFHGEIKANSQGLLITWHEGQRGISCELRSKWSIDFGFSWSPSQDVPAEISGCPSENRLVADTDDVILLYSKIFEQTYLTAWNGASWSRPVNQIELNAFIDEDTKASVDFRCHNFIEDRGNDLIVVGCDIGTGGDIWFLRRDIGTVEEWFPPFDTWGQPTNIYLTTDPVRSPLLISDQVNQIHAFWVEGRDINYTRLADGTWLAPAEVIRNQGFANIQLAATADQEGRLHVVYSGGQSGEIYYSWASVDRAISQPEWSEPFRIPMPTLAGGPPDILVDHLGRILIAYPIPLNENRGIYVTISTDSGATWSDPIQVFDAAAAGWEMIDQPKIGYSPDGWFQIIWTQKTIPNGIGPLALYNAASNDGGFTWSEPVILSNNPVLWSDIELSENNLVHILWQEEENNRLQVKHLYSAERGGPWVQGSTISSLGDIPELVQLTLDKNRNPIIVQVTEGGTENLNILLWRWDGNRWVTDPPLDLGDRGTLDINSMAIAVSTENRLGVLYSATDYPINVREETQNIFFSQKLLSDDFIVEISPDRPTLEFTQEETPAEVVTPVDTPAPTPLPTVIIDPPRPQTGPTGFLSNPLAGLLIGGLLSTFTVGLLFLFIRFRSRK